MNNAVHAYRIEAVSWPVDIDVHGPAVVYVVDARGETAIWLLEEALERADELANFDRLRARLASGEVYLHPGDAALWREWSAQH